MVPLALTSWRVTRNAGDGDPYEVDDLAGRFDIDGTLSSPSGQDRIVGGRQDSIDAALIAAPAPCIEAGDRVHGDGRCWLVVWVQPRRGLGLDHQRCGLRRVSGEANG